MANSKRRIVLFTILFGFYSTISAQIKDPVFQDLLLKYFENSERKLSEKEVLIVEIESVQFHDLNTIKRLPKGSKVHTLEILVYPFDDAYYLSQALPDKAFFYDGNPILIYSSNGVLFEREKRLNDRRLVKFLGKMRVSNGTISSVDAKRLIYVDGKVQYIDSPTDFYPLLLFDRWEPE